MEVYFVTSGNKKKCKNCFYYSELNQQIISTFKLIVNTTPLGIYPDMDGYPNLPYQFIGKQHLCYDLIYNPEITLFLSKSKAMGASIVNGLSMLHLQAEKSWEIWNS